MCIGLPGKSILLGGRAGNQPEEKRKKPNKPPAIIPSQRQVRGRERKEFRGMKLEDPETQRGKVALTGDSAC